MSTVESRLSNWLDFDTRTSHFGLPRSLEVMLRGTCDWTRDLLLPRLLSGQVELGA